MEGDLYLRGCFASFFELRAVCAVYIPAGESLIDSDLDEIPDFIDNCPSLANAFQVHSDGNGTGDACESSVIDPDGDGVESTLDNCPNIYTPTQADDDFDGIGNACDPSPTGSDCNPGDTESLLCNTTLPGRIVCEPGVQTRSCGMDGTWVYGTCVGGFSVPTGALCP